MLRAGQLMLLGGVFLALTLPLGCQSPQPAPTAEKQTRDIVFYRDFCQYCSAPWNSHMFRCQNGGGCAVLGGAKNSGPCPRCAEPWPPGLKEGPCPVCDAWFEVGPVIPGFGYSAEVEQRYERGNRSDPPNYR